MPTQEKLIKSIETLRKLSQPDRSSNSGNANIKKEKIQLCTIITDFMINSLVQLAPNFPILLNHSMEILLELCDDSDSDIRMFIEECLNKLIRGTRNDNMTKVLIEFVNEIKRNKSAKSLRTALVKFSKLVHYIRPHKGKPYVSNVFPYLTRITERTEEAVHETLSASLPKIIEVLGPFASDNDIKNLLKSFMANISNSSTVIKRTAAISILNVCSNCQKPYSTVVYCIHIVLGFVFPLDENCDNHLILGVMGVLKVLIPYWWKFTNDERKNEREKFGSDWGELKLDKLLQIYELCLHYLNHNDHNIVNYSLETLSVLLQNSTKELKTALLEPSGLPRINTRHSDRSSQRISTSKQHETSSNLEEHVEAVPENIPKNADTFYESMEIPKDRGSITKSLSQIDISTEILEKDSLLKSCTLDDGEIHIQDIDVGSFDDKDVPLLNCSRLIGKTFLLSGVSNGLISDKRCRISVKSSALMCFSSVLNLYPKLLTLYLDKNAIRQQGENTHQKMSDILLYSKHSDPQLRGNMRILIGNYVISVIHAKQQYEYGNESAETDDFVENFEDLMGIMESGLDDHFSCTRQTLQSLQLCLKVILESQYCNAAVPLLLKLPLMSKNPYWLIKVSLCELISSLPYVTIFDTIGNDQFQKNILNMILFEFLNDSDGRVRNSASNAISRLIPLLYYGNDAIISKGVHYRDILMSNLYNETWMKENDLKKNLTFPFDKIHDSVLENVEMSLSKIVSNIVNELLFSNGCKHTIFGCIEVLSLLSTKFPCTSYKNSWNCNVSEQHQKDRTNDLLKLCMDLMNNSEFAYEIGFHTNLLKLASNIYAGYSISILKPQVETIDNVKKWYMFESSSHSNLSEMFLKHIIKLLNISQNVIDDSYQKQIKPILLNLPTSSPMKRRKSDLEKKLISPTKNVDDKIERKDKDTSAMSSYTHLPHYVKIYELLKTSYSNYKTSLEVEASETFLNMLAETLKSLSILMEIGGLTEFGCLAEEILNCLNSVFRILPSETVECVQQLLKSIFGVNLAANQNDLINVTRKNEKVDNCSFHQQIFMKVYKEMSDCADKLKEMNKSEDIVTGFHRGRTGKRINFSRNLDKNLESYIRIFEPMVIKSLEQYTITSDVVLQGRVLQLLSQLIQLKINYCLLDSDQIFINFVLAQFEFIEEGQIRNSKELVPEIFQFLVQLSYSKQHTKSIITVPKIIQLCDGLIASGQSSFTYCIPALKPIIEDIFLVRSAQSAVDLKELETTREVLLAMLLRLIDNSEIVDLTVLILNDIKCCNNTDFSEKWPRWSRDVFKAVVLMLKLNKFKLDSAEALNSLKRLMLVLNPSVFRNIDDLIVMLFQEPPALAQHEVQFMRWLGRILIILTILSPLDEDAILAKITNLKENFNANSVFENVIITQDPLNVSNSADFFQHLPPETILTRFLFRTLTLATKKCNDLLLEPSRNCCFLIEELSMFMMFLFHSFQSGFLCKTANTAISVVEKRKYAEECDALNMEPLNENFKNFIHLYPILTFQWCYFLTLVNYEDRYFWDSVLQISEHEFKTSSLKNEKSINKKIIEVGACIVFCDYLCENLTRETDDVTWLLENKIMLLIDLIHEAQVNEFFSFVHRNPKLSRKILEIVEKNCLHKENLVFELKLLKSIENTHSSLTGKLLKLLLEKIITVKNSVLLKEILKLSTRKLEFLLTLPPENVRQQLDREDIVQILLKLNSKYEVLQGLLDKLSSKIHGVTIKELQKEVVDSISIKNLEINNEWYFEQVKSKCFKVGDTKIGYELAEMLSVLTYDEQIKIMQNAKFNRKILKSCFEFGANIQKKDGIVPEILKASVETLHSQISEFLQTIQRKKVDGFSLPSFNEIYLSIIPCLSFYLSSVSQIEIEQKPGDLIDFTLLSLKFFNIHFVKSTSNIDFLNDCLICFDVILRQNCFLNSSRLKTLCTSFIFILCELVEILGGEKFSCDISNEIMRKFECSTEGKACSLLYSLISVLFMNHNFQDCIPNFILKILRSIVISLGRLSLFNCFMLIPVKAWSKLRDSSSTSLSCDPFAPPSLPVELLQEIDILQEYIFRVNLLGWTNRQRFEETWMNLLSVLCNTPSDENNSEEINDIHTAIALVIEGISSLLIQTLYYPTTGWKNVSELLHVSRDPPLKCDRTDLKKLEEIQRFIKYEFNKTFFSGPFEVDSIFDKCNLEKFENGFSIGQLSIKYFLTALGMIEVSDEQDTSAYEVWKQRTEALERNSLDVNSCIQFLQDYYTQVLGNQVTSLKLLHELIRSILILSDLFIDRTQFSWMFDLFEDLLKTHSNEDEIVHEYLIIGLCKAIAVVNPEIEVYENVKKYLVQYLRNPSFSTQKACLNGLLYLFEGCKLNNITIGNISEEFQLILPCAVEYLQQNLPSDDNRSPNKTEEHKVLMWSLAFYIIENIDEEHIESTFVDNVLNEAISILSGNDGNMKEYKCVIRGFQRIIVIKNKILEKHRKRLVKLLLDGLKNDNPSKAVYTIQLLFVYMYLDCFKLPEEQNNPENLVQTIEKFSALFEHIKKGYVSEVEILCALLPQVINDFFTPADILTKVICEFLSAQQPHQKLLSKVIFHLFQSAIQQNQLTLLQDWIVFSLPNFTQNFSYPMATWCLTCFFICASCNKWLISLFPYVQTRIQRYEREDREMLCIAGSSFYRNLSNDKQKETFLKNFEIVQNTPEMPFNDLLSSL